MGVPVGLRQIRREDHYETRWIVCGPNGAVDFHCSNVEALAALREQSDRRWHFDRSGGVEYHYRSAPDYMREDPPVSEHCWVLNGPCWCDGSSLWASEHWIPLLERDGEAAIWRELHERYVRHDWPLIEKKAEA